MGHSHPECAFNDSLILGLSNFGFSAESYYYTYLKTRKIIANNKQIKVVFIEFTNNQINEGMYYWTWGDMYLSKFFPSYLPLMDFSDLDFLWKKNWKGIITCPPKLYMRNITYNILAALKLKNIETDNRFGGYTYLVRDKTDSLINISLDTIKEKSPSKISETNILYLSKTIEFCLSHNVKVYLIRSPQHPKYPEVRNEQQFKEILFSKFLKIEFLDFKDFPLQNYEFADLEHLNYKGARVFSIFFNNLLDLNLLNKNNKQDFIDNEISKISFSEPLNSNVAKNHIGKN